MHRKSLIALCTLAICSVAALAYFTPSANGATKAMGPVRHIVLLNLKDGVTPEQVKTLAEASEKMKGDVPEIQTLELGENLSSNTRNEGYTHCLYVTFADEAGLKAYGPSAGHETLKKTLMPLVEKVLVFDYVVK